MKKRSTKVRVLLAKPGLDGHDRGAKVVGMFLRNAGIEVIYTGLRQSIDEIVSAAIQEDVDVIALSILSGVHIQVARKLMERLKEDKLDEIAVIIGGVIPPRDIPILKRIGVKEIFPVHTSFEDILAFFDRRFGLATQGVG